MESVIKIGELVIPLIVELVKAMHADKSDQEHQEIVKQVTEHLKEKTHNAPSEQQQ